MRKLPKIFILVLLVGLLVPSLLNAQQAQQARHRFEQEFRNTNEVINHARGLITSSGLERGSEMLKLAEQIQTQARNMGMSRNFVNGLKLTFSARDKAKSAIMINRQASENENLVRRQLEKTEKVLERIRSSISTDAGHRIESLYNTAYNNQRRAREFYYNHQLRPALKLSRQVENTLNRLIERLKEMNGNLERLRNRINRLENKIIRVESMIEDCGNDRAGQILNEVKNRFENMKNRQNNRKLEGIENRLRSMNQHLNSAIEICQGTNFQTEQLNRLQFEMEKAAASIRESGNKQAQKLFKRAEKNLEKAERFCLAGDSEACAANIKAAQISLRKAKKLAGI